MSKIFVIACTGDSHTWGQGADGQVAWYAPPVEAGDLRLAPFCFQNYVSLVRREVCLLTGSQAFDELPDAELPLTLTTCARLVRLQFYCGNAEISVNGVPAAHAEAPDGCVPRCFRTITLQLRGESKLRLEGTAKLWRAEYYFGSHAVVNCGVGSCPSSRYEKEFYNQLVAPLQPSAVLAEAHTINDMLTGITPEKHAADLASLLARCRADGAKTVLLTVAPVCGRQDFGIEGIPFADYVKASLGAAVDSLVADAYERILPVVTEKTQPLFTDNWHVNALGHRLYAECAMEQIRKIIL